MQEQKRDRGKKPKLSIIAALSRNRVMGKKNTLPWYLPEDLKRFKKLTTGHPIIMGRKTYKSIGKPLPNRTNIIITRDINFKAEGCLVTHSLPKALEQAKTSPGNLEIFIIGGGEIYKQTLDLADKLYLTVIEQDIEGDVYFPDFADFKKIIHQEEGESEGYKYKFLELER